MTKEKSKMIIYETEDGQPNLDIHFEDETVWLSIEQMSNLFQKSRSTINEHILNIYKSKELEKQTTMRKIGISDYSTKPTNFYNLDVIISVGYRVKSVYGTELRQWVIENLHEHISESKASYLKRLLSLISDFLFDIVKFFKK